jgi:hypothetical protein
VGSRRHALVGSLALVCAVALAIPAAGELEASALSEERAKDAARPLAQRGYELYELGRYAEAIELFRQAEARYHAPPHLLYIARGLAELGRFLEARRTYASVAGEVIAPDAPAQFHQARSDAERELAALEPRIPVIEIDTNVEARGADVWIDRRRVGRAPVRVPVDPGAHEIVLRPAEGAGRSRTVTLAAGQSVRLDFEVEAAPTELDPLVPGAVAAFAVSGVALAVGIGTGVASLAKVADLEEACPDRRCPPELEESGAEAERLGNVSTVMFVVAGVGAATGATLLLIGSERWSGLRARPALAGLLVDGWF